MSTTGWPQKDGKAADKAAIKMALARQKHLHKMEPVHAHSKDRNLRKDQS